MTDRDSFRRVVERCEVQSFVSFADFAAKVGIDKSVLLVAMEKRGMTPQLLEVALNQQLPRDTLAAHMGLSIATVYRYLEKVGEKWPHLKERKAGIPPIEKMLSLPPDWMLTTDDSSTEKF